MVFQKSNPFPKIDLRERGLRPAGGRRCATGPSSTTVVERCLKQAALWDEVKDRLHELGPGPVRRPAAAAVHRPGAGHRPGGAAHGRAGHRPSTRRARTRIEDLIFELKRDYTIVIVTHNMQQAARVSDATAFFFEGRLVEVGPDRADVHPARPRSRRRTTSPGGSDEPVPPATDTRLRGIDVEAPGPRPGRPAAATCWRWPGRSRRRLQGGPGTAGPRRRPGPRGDRRRHRHRRGWRTTSTRSA